MAVHGSILTASRFDSGSFVDVILNQWETAPIKVPQVPVGLQPSANPGAATVILHKAVTKHLKPLFFLVGAG